MKISEKTAVIYNSLRDKAVFSDADSLRNLIENNSQDVDSHIASVAFVDDAYNEYECYIHDVSAIENQTVAYHLIINPTLECIFSCWYCYEHHGKGRMREEVIERIKKFIVNLSDKYESLTISFFGGEPLMCYNSVILPVVKYAYDTFFAKGKTFTFNMTSNGYLLTEDRILKMKQYGFVGAQITIDGDREIHNRTRFLFGNRPTYDRIIGNIKLLAENDCYVTLRLNCTHDNIVSFYSLSESLNDLSDKARNKIAIDCHIVWQEKEKKLLQQKQHGLIAHLFKHRLKASKMDFRQLCYADKRAQCVVNFNGDIYKCTAIDFQNVQRDGFLSDDGKLIWENNSLERRMQSKTKNERCKSCRVLPLCHGGCSSRALEAEDGYCLYPLEDEKDQMVINRLEYILTMKRYE